MQTIYEPKGKAKEYSEEIKNGSYSNLALNIYSGCQHGCTYCYVPKLLRTSHHEFHGSSEPRHNILFETQRLLNKGFFNASDYETQIVGGIPTKIKTGTRKVEIKGKTIFLSFTSDPFPMCCSQQPTYDVISAIKESGNSVRILTKGNPDITKLKQLLDKEDWFGITISCGDKMAKEKEPKALIPSSRIVLLQKIKTEIGCKTFVSCEPVLEQQAIYNLIEKGDFIDAFKIGKLNHLKSDINWQGFAKQCIYLCEKHNRNYMLKHDLQKCLAK